MFFQMLSVFLTVIAFIGIDSRTFGQSFQQRQQVFALMGIGAARIYLAPASNARSRSLLLFFVQLAFNFFWSIIFFNLQAFGFAFLWLIALWVLILLMILSFRKVDQPTAWLQVPYLLWVTFAAYLNLGVWLLNR